jgi:hypothetical protein
MWVRPDTIITKIDKTSRHPGAPSRPEGFFQARAWVRNFKTLEAF